MRPYFDQVVEVDVRACTASLGTSPDMVTVSTRPCRTARRKPIGQARPHRTRAHYMGLAKAETDIQSTSVHAVTTSHKSAHAGAIVNAASIGKAPRGVPVRVCEGTGEREGLTACSRGGIEWRAGLLDVPG